MNDSSVLRVNSAPERCSLGRDRHKGRHTDLERKTDVSEGGRERKRERGREGGRERERERGGGEGGGEASAKKIKGEIVQLPVFEGNK